MEDVQREVCGRGVSFGVSVGVASTRAVGADVAGGSNTGAAHGVHCSDFVDLVVPATDSFPCS